MTIRADASTDHRTPDPTRLAKLTRTEPLRYCERRSSPHAGGHGPEQALLAAAGPEVGRVADVYALLGDPVRC